MSHLTLLHCPEPSADARAQVLARIPGELVRVEDHWRLHHDRPIGPEVLAELRRLLPFDINPVPEGFEPDAVGLIVSDMDSTLITIECIDELADRLDLKPQVAAITEAAMAGELDFADALRQRVALLEGLAEEELLTVYRERLRFSPGAALLAADARSAGIKTAVVSGGFTFFTERVRLSLDLDFARANELEIVNGRLTGRVQGEICGPEQKARFLEELRRQLGLRPAQCIAIGDGANDLLMLTEAGLGVAFCAKPRLEAAADAVIRHGGLDNVSHFFKAAP
jgi:phosphoserine phosphatase